jgi:hypothetical protein
MSRHRAVVGIVIAAAMIAGWFLRVGSELLPGWEGLAVPVSALVVAALIEVLDRRVEQAISDTETNPSGGDR